MGGSKVGLCQSFANGNHFWLQSLFFHKFDVNEKIKGKKTAECIEGEDERLE